MEQHEGMMTVTKDLSLPEIEPAFGDSDAICVCFAFDSKFVPMFAAQLESIIDNAGRNNYDLCVLYSDLKQNDMDNLKKIVSGKENFSLRFFNVSTIFDRRKLSTRIFFINTTYTAEMYYRLAIPWMFSKYDKVIYLDSDSIVLCDLAELWNIDITGCTVAAVRDYFGIALCTGVNKEMTEYRNNLKLERPYDYFNSGVMVFDTAEFRARFNYSEIMGVVESKEWKQHDQDVLNVLCNSSVKILDGGYNVNIDPNNICSHLPKELLDERKKLSDKPKIIHYAGKYKPIRSVKSDLYSYFWKYLSRTQYYDDYYGKINCVYYRIRINFDYLKSNVEFHYNEVNRTFEIGNGNKKICDASEFMVSIIRFTVSGELLHLYGYILAPPKDCMPDNHSFVMTNGANNNDLFIIKETYSDKYKKLYRELWFSADITLSDGDKIKFGMKVDDNVFSFSSILFGKATPFSKLYPNSFYSTANHIVRYEGDSITVEKRNPLLLMKYELKMFVDVRRNEPTKLFVNYLLARIGKRLFTAVFPRMKIWLLYDRIQRAGDNAEYFYYYCNEKKGDDFKPFFVIDGSTEDFKRIPGAVGYGTFRFKVLFLIADSLLSSQFDQRLFYYLGDSGLYRSTVSDHKRIFLQHGIIKDDMSKELNVKKHVFTKFITSTRQEYESILKYSYGYTKDEVVLTGLARYDRLHDDSKKIVTIAPTWRRELMSTRDSKTATWAIGSNYESSTFHAFYDKLLNDTELIDYLESEGYTMQLLPHPTLSITGRPRLIFKTDPRIKVLEGMVDYTKAYAESCLMITDFSSMIFDFAYLKKPVLYAHFDVGERGFNYSKADFFSYENDGFGDIVTTEPELASKIKEIIDGGCIMSDKYKERVDRFFEFHDRNNCERIYNALMKETEDH